MCPDQESNLRAFVVLDDGCPNQLSQQARAPKQLPEGRLEQRTSLANTNTLCKKKFNT